MWEKILIPLAGTLLFLLMSGGFMLTVGGATSRMQIVLRSVSLFVAIMLYSMAWHRELERTFNWPETWIATTVAGGVLSVLVARYLFARRERNSDSQPIP
jgi:hypothetical protein